MLLCVISFSTFKAYAQHTDIDLLRKINASGNAPMDKFQRALSYSVYPALTITPSTVFVLGILQKDTVKIKKGICIAAGLAINAALTIGVKYAVNRPRPYVTYPDIKTPTIEKTPSMPSGHTSSAFSIATSLTLNYPKWYVALPAYTWASSIAYSRIYLGVHYPSDIVAGALLGSGTAWLSWYINKNILRKQLKNNNH